jgi:hypothetical protein
MPPVSATLVGCRILLVAQNKLEYRGRATAKDLWRQDRALLLPWVTALWLYFDS